MKRFGAVSVGILIFLLARAPSPAGAETLVYALEHYGREVGRWGVDMNRDETRLVLSTASRFPKEISGLQLLKGLCGEKRLALDPQSAQKVCEIRQNDLKWDISNDGHEVLVKRYQGNKQVDQLGIHPILPVYDLTAILFLFRSHTGEAPIDFYFIDRDHEKMLTLYRDGRDRWTLKFRNASLVRVVTENDGLVRELDFSSSDISEVTGYKMVLKCRRQSALQAVETIGPGEIARRLLKQQPSVRLDGVSWTFHMEKRPGGEAGYRIAATGPPRPLLDMNQAVQEALISEMSGRRIFLQGSGLWKRLQLGYDPKQNSAYGWIPVSAVPDSALQRRYGIAALKQDILTRLGQDVRFDPIQITSDYVIVLPYSTHRCTERVFQEFDLRNEFLRQFGKEFSSFSHEMVQGGIRITGRPMEGSSSSPPSPGGGGSLTESSEAQEAIGPSPGDARTATLFFRLPAACGQGQSGQPRFVLEDLPRGLLRIGCTACATEVGRTEMDPRADFERDLGVSRRYLTCSIGQAGEEIVVTVDRAIAYTMPMARLQDTLVRNLAGTGIAVKQARLRYDQQGGFWMDGSPEFLVSDRQIKESMDLGEHALIEAVDGQGLRVRFLDFRCP